VYELSLLPVDLGHLPLQHHSPHGVSDSEGAAFLYPILVPGHSRDPLVPSDHESCHVRGITETLRSKQVPALIR
jgi:hypothetical protein